MEDIVAYVDRIYRECEDHGVSVRESFIEAIRLADVLITLPQDEWERLLKLPVEVRLAVLRSKTKSSRCRRQQRHLLAAY